MPRFEVFREIRSWKRPFHIVYALVAKFYLMMLPQVEVIGITGSVGKTLTQNAIYSVLSQKYKVVVGNENLDPTFRIPKTILKTRPWHEKLVLEYGVEHPGDMDHYLSIAKPKIAIVTKISPTHIKYFKDAKGVFAEKVKLVESLNKSDYAVLNADDPLVVKMAARTHARVLWYGEKAKGGVKISHFSQSIKGSKFRMHYDGQKATVSTKVVGKHQLASSYAAAAVGNICGLTLKQIAKGLLQVAPPEHRLNAISTKKVNIIDDTYNSSPLAAVEALATLRDLGKRKEKIAVLGEMKDLGSLSKSAHVTLGQKVARSSVNILVTVGKVAQEIAMAAKKAGFTGKIYKANNTQDAINFIKEISNSKTLILVKGSRHAHLERIVFSFTKKSTEINCYHCGNLK